MKKSLYAFIGIVMLIIGSIGTIVPILPTVPFLMISAFCFAHSSKRLNDWFMNSKLYKDNFEDFVCNKGMTLKVKLKVMAVVTVLMLIGFIIMGIKGVIPGCIVLACVWLFHVLYFMFKVKTLPAKV